MPEIDQFLTSYWAFWAVLVVAGAGWIHGVMGMGFPLITIALVAMTAVLKTAVLVTVLPNIAVNLYSIAKGGNWAHSLGSHWRIAVYVPLGAVVGTEMLLRIPAEPLKLLLAGMILLYLDMARLKRLSWNGLRMYPQDPAAADGGDPPAAGGQGVERVKPAPHGFPA